LINFEYYGPDRPPSKRGNSSLEDTPENTALEIATKVAGVIPAVAIVGAIREHFLNRRRIERVSETFVVFQTQYVASQKECAGNRERFNALSVYVKSPEFAEPAIAAAEEAVRTTNVEKIKQLGEHICEGVQISRRVTAGIV
jgi:hypothetical protein